MISISAKPCILNSNAIPCINNLSLKAFNMEIEENHMRLQEEKGDDYIRAFYGDEYMGYFDKSINKGFLFLEPLTPQGQFVFQ